MKYKDASGKSRKLIGIMSCPRTGFSHTDGIAKLIFCKYGIQIVPYYGAYWEQGIQLLCQKIIKEGFDDVVTLDYDSIFTEEQFVRMLSYWCENQNVDALAPLQPKRGGDLALMCPLDCDEGKVQIAHSHDGTEVKWAHFGLTFLRLDKLKTIPKPWFWSQPDENGDWKTDKSIDADIYFWKKWRAHGFGIRVLTDVLMGHLEVMVSQINPITGKAQYRIMEDWTDDPFGGFIAHAPSKESYRDKFHGDSDKIRSSYPIEWQTPQIPNENFNWIMPYNVTSQFGEDGILNSIFEKIGVKYLNCFEVGASDGEFFSNTKALRDKGWSATLGECDPKDFERLKLNFGKKYKTINVTLSNDYGIDFFFGGQNYDLGVIDTDSGDAIFWQKMQMKPRVMVIECAEQWGQESSKQALLSSLIEIGNEKKYTLAAVTYCNAIFIADEELRDCVL